MNRRRDAALVYLDARMATLFFLGFSSGLPLLLVGSTLSFWLLQQGFSMTAVGVFTGVAVPYSLKPLWAPMVDRLHLPLLTRLLGQRRAWMLVTQLGIIVALLYLSISDLVRSPAEAGLLAIVVATLSATQDIVIDAYRVEVLSPDEQGAGAAAAVFGYRVAMLVASAGALYLFGFLEAWPLVYQIMAAMMMVGVITTLLARRLPVTTEEHAAAADRFIDAVLGPFREFVSRPGWLLLLAFAVFFKLGDGVVGTMTNPLLMALNFTPFEIANIAKTFGLVATLVGIASGGFLVRSVGILRALLIAGILQMGSNIMFAVQAQVGHDVLLLAATVSVENFTGGIGTSVFVAYLSSLCHRGYTATQYALLTALAGSARHVLGMGTGWVEEQLGWVNYFLATVLVALPGLVLLFFIWRRGIGDYQPSSGAAATE